MSLNRKIIKFLDDREKKKNFKKGESFEEFVKDYVFPDEKFILIRSTQDYRNNERYVEGKLEPDLYFRDRKTNETFFVECKFRSNLYQNKLQWAKDKTQFKRYKEFQEKVKPEKVFVVVGLGGKPYDPERVFKLPLEEIKYPALFESVFKKYELELTE